MEIRYASSLKTARPRRPAALLAHQLLYRRSFLTVEHSLVLHSKTNIPIAHPQVRQLLSHFLIPLPAIGPAFIWFKHHPTHVLIDGYVDEHKQPAVIDKLPIAIASHSPSSRAESLHRIYYGETRRMRDKTGRGGRTQRAHATLGSARMRREAVIRGQPGSNQFYSTSRIISISTGMLKGSSATPTAERACLPIASPKTSTMRSEKPLMTFG